MNKTLITGLSALAILAAMATMGISSYNSMVDAEKGVIGVWRDSQIQHDTFWKSVKETAQVTDAYKDAFMEAVTATADARYAGKDPAVSLIMEANPTLDPATFVKVQQVIESGRREFAATQRTLVDRQRAYDAATERFPNNLFAGIMGFPRPLTGEIAPADDIDGDGVKTVLDYRIVTSTTTQEAFRTGREDAPVNVFGE